MALRGVSTSDRTKAPPVVGLIGTKSDPVHQRQVALAEAVDLARELGCLYFEPSTANDAKIRKVVKALAWQMNANRDHGSIPYVEQPATPIVEAHQGKLIARKRLRLLFSQTGLGIA